MKTLNDFDTQIQCEEIIPDYWEELDGAMEDLHNDPDFVEGCDHIIGNPDGCDGLFDKHGGLTADAFALLAEWDSKGLFV